MSVFSTESMPSLLERVNAFSSRESQCLVFSPLSYFCLPLFLSLSPFAGRVPTTSNVNQPQSFRFLLSKRLPVHPAAACEAMGVMPSNGLGPYLIFAPYVVLCESFQRSGASGDGAFLLCALLPPP